MKSLLSERSPDVVVMGEGRAELGPRNVKSRLGFDPGRLSYVDEDVRNSA